MIHTREDHAMFDGPTRRARQTTAEIDRLKGVDGLCGREGTPMSESGYLSGAGKI